MIKKTFFTLVLVVLTVKANASKLRANPAEDAAESNSKNGPLTSSQLANLRVPGNHHGVIPGLQDTNLNGSRIKKKLRDGRHEPREDVMQLLDKAEEKKIDEEEQRELNNEKETSQKKVPQKPQGGGMGNKMSTGEAMRLKKNLRYADATSHNVNTEGMENRTPGVHHQHHHGRISSLLHGHGGVVEEKQQEDAPPADEDEDEEEDGDNKRKLHGHGRKDHHPFGYHFDN